MSNGEQLMSAEAADKLLASADGTAALLYLHILRRGRFSLTEAAGVLRCSEAETGRAAETLRRLGLLPQPEQPLPSEELPAVRTEDIVRRAQTDGTFRDLVQETEKTLGRVLSSNDLETLFGIYDHIGLPADVIMVLMYHCIEEYQARSGPGRMPTMRYIEKEAWFWARQEILNLDAAEEHLQRERQRKETMAQVRAVLQIRGREFTAAERKHVEGWLAQGFGPEAIAIAYDRTVYHTGRLAWKYMDSILRSWDEKGLYTPEAIVSGDKAPQRQRPAAQPTPDSKRQIQDLQKLYNSISGKKEG